MKTIIISPKVVIIIFIIEETLYGLLLISVLLKDSIMNTLQIRNRIRNVHKKIVAGNSIAISNEEGNFFNSNILHTNKIPRMINVLIICNILPILFYN